MNSFYPASFRLCCIAILLFVLGTSAASSQEANFRNKKIGLYISSKNVSYTDDYYLYIVQFLKINEDRSWVGKMKTELLVRTGELLCKEIQRISEADTVYFLNADPQKGGVLLNLYDVEQKKFVSDEALDNLDHLFVIDKLELTVRETQSVYIRSNRMFSEKVNVKIGELYMGNFDNTSLSPQYVTHICFDDRDSPNPPKYFDLYFEESTLGRFFSRLFSQWWSLHNSGEVDTCN